MNMTTFWLIQMVHTYFDECLYLDMYNHRLLMVIPVQNLKTSKTYKFVKSEL